MAFGPVFALAVMGLVLSSLAMLRRARGEQQALLQLRETARVAADEAQRRQAAESLLHQVQRTESLGQVAVGAVHDLNNVLNVVVGNLELMRGRSNDPWFSKRADEALGAARLAENLLGSLMAFATRRPLAPMAVDVDALLHNMGDMLRRALAPEVALELSLAAADARADVDPVQVELAVLNMVLNARDARPADGRVTVATATVRLDGEPDGLVGDFVAVAVEDKGQGMAAAVLARAFEPFFTTKSPGRGVGLGLAQIRAMAKRHGGSVAIATEVGRGTRVTLYLPHSARTAAPSA
jgi:signal transduction histidine kinase